MTRLRSLSRVLLTLDEVREAGRTAYFLDYGEALLFTDGQVFEVSEVIRARQIDQRPSPLPDAVAEAGVGIEYGWRHVADCDCRTCASQRDVATPVRLRAVALPDA